MLLVLIVGCEAAFWLFLLTGLLLRYVLRSRRTGAVVLACVPLIDVVLLVATVVHLRSGATPDVADGLAAAYIGVTVAFGPGIVRRMDARFAHRSRDATPAPVRQGARPLRVAGVPQGRPRLGDQLRAPARRHGTRRRDPARRAAARLGRPGDAGAADLGDLARHVHPLARQAQTDRR